MSAFASCFNFLYIFRPPLLQLLCGAQRYSTKVDIWGFGILLVQLSAINPPFADLTHAEMLAHLVVLIGTPAAVDVDVRPRFLSWYGKHCCCPDVDGLVY